VKSDETTVAQQNIMMRKTPSGAPGLIRTRLAYLRRRKAVLDELIRCLERYQLHLSSAPEWPTAGLSKPIQEAALGRLAGAA
jgi:hypothetical protein